MPEKKSPAKKAAKKAVKKTAKKATKKTVKKVAKKAAKKVATTKKVAAKKTSSAKSEKVKKVVTRKKSASKSSTKASNNASASFSLEEAMSIAKKRTKETNVVDAKKAEREKAKRAIEEAERKAEKRVLGAASLADILGYNPSDAGNNAKRPEQKVAKKYEKFYKLLVELRDHVQSGLSMHTEETLKRSSKEDTGDLSGYSQHMADAGTDTFDRDFALSMVSNEQEALHEVEEAIERIYNGTYGICEMTGKQIREERLLAVPFTRYSVETQSQIEKNTHKSVQRGGAFADATADDSMSFGDENPDS